MSVQEMMNLRNLQDEETKMSLLLAIHCSPVIVGIKSANIITVTEREFVYIGYLLQGTGISYRFLKTGNDKGILYLYRERELIKCLYSVEIQSFLEEYGYVFRNLEEMLDCLSERINLYSQGKTSFPHEIGVFLGYPLLDVKGFLENEGKNFIYSGYWKVYQNVQNTVKTFRQYDEQREHVIQAVISGEKIRDIVMESQDG